MEYRWYQMFPYFSIKIVLVDGNHTLKLQIRGLLFSFLSTRMFCAVIRITSMEERLMITHNILSQKNRK